jgi:hypothetical protein
VRVEAQVRLHALNVVRVDAAADVHAAERLGGQNGAAATARKLCHTKASRVNRLAKVANVHRQLIVESHQQPVQLRAGRARAQHQSK